MDLATMKKDLHYMKYYRDGLKAVANSMEKDLSEGSFECFKPFIERTIRILDRMNKQCEYYIEIGAWTE